MKISQPKKNNPYLMEDNIYKLMIFTIRDYARIKANPLCHSDIDIIMTYENSLAKIPVNFRKAIVESICNNKKNETECSRKEFQMYKCRLIFELADGLNYI